MLLVLDNVYTHIHPFSAIFSLIYSSISHFHFQTPLILFHWLCFYCFLCVFHITHFTWVSTFFFLSSLACFVCLLSCPLCVCISLAFHFICSIFRFSYLLWFGMQNMSFSNDQKGPKRIERFWYDEKKKKTKHIFLGLAKKKSKTKPHHSSAKKKLEHLGNVCECEWVTLCICVKSVTGIIKW